MRVLLVCEPGYYRDGLVALLHTLPSLEVVCQNMGDAVYDWPFTESPDLVIVAVDSFTDSLRSIRERWPKSRILVLIDRSVMTSDGNLSYADGVLNKSLSAGVFLSSITNSVDDRLVIECNEINVIAQAETW